MIIQNDSLIGSLPTVLVVPLTSTQGAMRFDGTLLVQPDGQNGLTTASVALVFQLRAVDKRDCVQRLGLSDDATLHSVLNLVDAIIR